MDAMYDVIIALIYVGVNVKQFKKQVPIRC